MTLRNDEKKNEVAKWILEELLEFRGKNAEP
jgi:hypothetical protein